MTPLLKFSPFRKEYKNKARSNYTLTSETNGIKLIFIQNFLLISMSILQKLYHNFLEYCIITTSHEESLRETPPLIIE